MAIGSYLKGLRKKAGYTIRDVVEMTCDEIDKTTISRIERDERGLSFKAAFYFSEIYGIDLNEMAKKMLGSKARVKKIKIVKKTPGRKKGSGKKS
jgi:transcriptional regulator with XRE-family HTH domain